MFLDRGSHYHWQGGRSRPYLVGGLTRGLALDDVCVEWASSLPESLGMQAAGLPATAFHGPLALFLVYQSHGF